MLASHNQGKLLELQLLMRDHLAPLSLRVTSVAAMGLPEPAETASTFEGNAKLKALAAMAKTDDWVISDDSGLEVDALGGKPGVLSARWAYKAGGWKQAMAKIATQMEEAQRANPSVAKTARFVCVICLGRRRTKNGEVLKAFEGKCEGEITYPPRGAKGFGYDPIFVANNQTLTFGEMEPSQKQLLSHRYAAFSKLVAYISGQTSAKP